MNLGIHLPYCQRIPVTPDRSSFFRWIAMRATITLLFASLLYQLGQIPWILPYAGDGHYTEELARKDWVVLMHSSLTTLIHKLIFTALQPLGWSAWQAISFSSALAGGIALQVFYAIRRNSLFLVLNVLSGSFLVFVGQVESYAWVNLFLLFTFLAVEKYLTEEWPFWPVAVFIFIAALFHMLAIFYLPALFWIMRKYPRFKVQEFLFPFLGFLIGSIMILFLFPHEGLDMDLSRFTPLFHISRKGQLFTFFSLKHWEILAFFHWKGCFLQCLPLEIPLLFLLGHRIDSAFKRYLLICSLLGLAWTTAWHPDLGRLDWDLFSQPFIPIHILLGILLSEWWQDRIQRQKSSIR